MARRWAVMAALISATLVAAADPEPEPGVRPEGRWQYAELHQRETPARMMDDGSVIEGKVITTWSTSAAKVSGDGWEDMAKKLKAPAPAKAAEVNHKLRVMDQLGAQGWELVSVELPAPRTAAVRGAASARPSTTWLFKRKLAK